MQPRPLLTTLDGPLKRRVTSSSTSSSQLERTLPFQPEWLAIINLLFHTTTKPHLLSFTVSKIQYKAVGPDYA